MNNVDLLEQQIRLLQSECAKAARVITSWRRACQLVKKHSPPSLLVKCLCALKLHNKQQYARKKLLKRLQREQQWNKWKPIPLDAEHLSWGVYEE